MKAIDAWATALAAEGVRVAVNVPDEVTVFVAEALRDQGVRIVRPRHEQNGVLVADGYARSTGKVGLCIVGPGPSIAQTGTALVTAQKKRSQVLILLGQTQSAPGHAKEFDARRFIEATGGRFLAVRGVNSLAQDVAEAFRLVRQALGPVVLALPDRQQLAVELDSTFSYVPVSRKSRPPLAVDPRSELIEEAAATVAQARFPIIFAGAGAVAAGAGSAIMALAERSGALLSTSLQARGYFEGHPGNVGILGTFAPADVPYLLAQADCVVAIGVSLNPHQTGGGTLAPNARVIQIDSDPTRLGATQRVHVGIAHDARAAVDAINAALEVAEVAKPNLWFRNPVRTRVLATQLRPPPSAVDSPLPASHILSLLDTILPSDRFVIVDGGLFMVFVIDQIAVAGPDSWLWTLDFGSIGLGLGLGMGAALGRPQQRCVLFVGDGGLAMSLQELETLLREEIPLTVVILNDSAYAAESLRLETMGMPKGLAEFRDVDFAEVPRAFGASAITVRTIDDMAALEKLMASGTGPLVVDIKVTEYEDHRFLRELATRTRTEAGE